MKKDIENCPYELMLITTESSKKMKDELIIEINKLIAPNKIEIDDKNSQDGVNLAYKIKDYEKVNRLNLRFTTSKEKIVLLKKLLKKPFILRELLLNLNKEKKVKLKKGINIKNISIAETSNQ